MSGRGRVLDALLGSIASDLARHDCLDLTTDGVGAALLARRAHACATDPRSEAGYGLVICERENIDRALRWLDPHGSLLAFFRRGHVGDSIAPHEIVARVRCPEGEWRLVRPRPVPPAPAVSIVVIVRDQAQQLARLVEALLTVAPEPTWELVVIDRGSFDATAELLRHVDGDVQAFRAPRDTTRTHATYLGLLRARGELIAVLDPDLVPDPGLVVGLRRAADQHGDADVFAGPVRGDAIHMLAVRRSVVHGDGDASPDAIAYRLRRAPPTLVPAFTARRA